MNPFKVLVRTERRNITALQAWTLLYAKTELRQFAKLRYEKKPLKWSELPT